MNFSNIESVVNKEHGLALEKKEEEDENFFQDVKWLFFVGGYSERNIKTREIFENRIYKLGLDLYPNHSLLLYMQCQEMKLILRDNNMKIHAYSGEILVRDFETRENFFDFLRHQLREPSKLSYNILVLLGALLRII